MVIANSDSNTTLVNLDQYYHGLKFAETVPTTTDGTFASSAEHLEDELQRTELCVEDWRSSWIDDDTAAKTKLVPLYLPQDGKYLDKIVLSHIGSLRESCEELLLRTKPRYFTSKSKTRLLYVAQGERANATDREFDVLVSDKATTCHIMALRSYGSICNNNDNFQGKQQPSALPLTSMTHLDGTSYEDCIRKMVHEHVVYQSEQSNQSLCSDSKKVEVVVTIEMHIMGGFDDPDSTSSNITDWLVALLARIARDYKKGHTAFSNNGSPISLQMVLKTCAVTSMNDTGRSCPVGRGLGIDLKTGEVFLAKCHSNATGPVPVLRSVRLWSKNNRQGPTLSVIHSVTDRSALPGRVVVRPFRFAPFPDIHYLLTLSDDDLVQYTSTSPDVEEDGFCQDVRASMKFLLQQHPYMIFGRKLDQPLVFSRTHHANEWKQAAC
ncbi:asparagine amidohydrolase [Nitzschia inconspicua]|uniref:Asparagine amidohydrolase n=1 Tax=Nitzschia inconspicua TaxID=303405 RepID=A0A9K3L4G6_9STRA|nr:asparagine amidohydrolase [Nitzschia inconspicua]